MKKPIVTIMSALLLLCGSCASDLPADEPIPNDNNSTDVVQKPVSDLALRTATGFNNFAFRMLDRAVVMNNDAAGNVVLSPMSMSVTMAMLANGADGTTRSEILSALAAEGVTLKQINDACGELLSYYWGVRESKVSFANSLWIDSKFPILDSFRKDVNQIYSAEVRNMSPLASNASIQEINRWVSDATNSLIPRLIDDASLYLKDFAIVNALYLKSQWSEAFSTTEPGSFANADGSKGAVEYLKGVVTATVSESNDMQILTLDLSDGFCISVMLPESRRPASSLISELTSESLTAAAQAEAELCEVAMPKLSLEYSLDEGAKLLCSLGIRELFGDNADLSRLTSGHTLVTEVLQKSKLNLDEEGIEAAGATVAGNFILNGVDAHYRKIEVNRPFVFAVWHKPTASIFFNGVVNRIN